MYRLGVIQALLLLLLNVVEPWSLVCISKRFQRHQTALLHRNQVHPNEIECENILSDDIQSRRKLLTKGFNKIGIATAIVTLTSTLQPTVVTSKPDCYTDCYKNCKVILPKDDIYCQESCIEYCTQTDRRDGLSGSIDAEQGEVGILGGSFGTGTVVKGQDKPPSLGTIPGLDFTSESGKKLIGY